MNRVTVIIGPVGLLIIWGILSKLEILDPFFLPHPKMVFSEMFVLIKSGTVLQDILATGIRTMEAFTIAVFVGVPVGLFLGNTERIFRSSEFVLDFFRSTPATAIFPLFLLIFGIGDTAKIAAASFGAMLIIIFNTAYGVINSKKPRLLAAQAMGASRWQIFRLIILQESLPQTFIGMRNSVSLALIIIVITEMFIGTDIGLGRRIVDSQIVYNIRAMYAAIIMTGVLGYIFNFSLLRVERKYVHWIAK